MRRVEWHVEKKRPVLVEIDETDGLAAEQQAILKYANEAASSATLWKAYDRYSKDLIALQEEDGVTVRRTPADVLQAQLEAWDAVTEQLSSDDFFRRVIETQRDWSKRVVFNALYNSADYRLAYEHHFGPLEM